MSRAVKIGGGVLAAGAGYYLFRAGGDTTAAKKRFEGMLDQPSTYLTNLTT
jgi:hypothetical protein